MRFVGHFMIPQQSVSGNEELKRDNEDLKTQVAQMRDLINRLMNDNGAVMEGDSYDG